MSAQRSLNILITGCSPGGIGAALASKLHSSGHRVYATARNSRKLQPLASEGMETLALDVTSDPSIASAVSALSSLLGDDQGLDMLVNNAAGSYSMPVADIVVDEARKLFETNVWGPIRVTQAFLPLLLKSARATSSEESGFQPMIVNHSSVGSVAAIPWQSPYNASKAAFSMFSQSMRMELAPFGIRVVELKTAGVHTNIINNNNFNTKSDRLPKDSIYIGAREVVEKAISQEELTSRGISPEEWADEVSALLLGKNPPTVIWKGESALVSRVASMLPTGLFEGMLKNMTKLDEVERIIKEKGN